MLMLVSEEMPVCAHLRRRYLGVAAHEAVSKRRLAKVPHMLDAGASWAKYCLGSAR